MKRSIACIAATSFALLSGCGGSAPPAPAVSAPQAKKPAAAPTEVTPVEAPPPYLYAYNPLGKRDPFRSFAEEVIVGEETHALCNEPLCQWDLDQLTLVAVVSGEANPVAMLEDPGRIGHVVRRNTKVGKQGGKVTQILRDCVIVTEFWTGPDGKVNPNPVKMCIKDEGPRSQVIDLMNSEMRWQ